LVFCRVNLDKDNSHGVTRVEKEADFGGKIDSIMDIFRRTDMKIFSKDVIKRMTLPEGHSERPTQEQLKRIFYEGTADLDEKDTFRHKREVVRSVITDKTRKIVNNLPNFRNAPSNEIVASLSGPLRDVVEESSSQVRTRLFSNFKNLNQGVRHSIEYKINPPEVIRGLKTKYFCDDEDLEDNMRKKFLHEKIELFYRLIKEIKDFTKMNALYQIKVDLLRDFLHQRHKQMQEEELQLAKLKEEGKISVECFMAGSGIGMEEEDTTANVAKKGKGRKRNAKEGVVGDVLSAFTIGAHWKQIES
jgi:hypothetical protein